MERIWNYFFYSTWNLQINLGEILIRKPIYFIMPRIFPVLLRNLHKGAKDYNKVMNNKDRGLNIGFAFGFMFLTMVPPGIEPGIPFVHEPITFILI